MLREEMEKYTKLTGEDGTHVPIMKLGAYLDGYEKGIEALDKIRAEIRDGLCGSEEMNETDTERAEAFNNGLNYCTDIIDKYRQEG